VLPYTKPQLTRDGYRFALDGGPDRLGHAAEPRRESRDAVGAHQQVWLLANPQRPHELAGALRTACRVGGEEVFGPFTLTLLSDCRP
jgi:hypothetical protein